MLQYNIYPNVITSVIMNHKNTIPLLYNKIIANFTLCPSQMEKRMCRSKICLPDL